MFSPSKRGLGAPPGREPVPPSLRAGLGCGSRRASLPAPVELVGTKCFAHLLPPTTSSLGAPGALLFHSKSVKPVFSHERSFAQVYCCQDTTLHEGTFAISVSLEKFFGIWMTVLSTPSMPIAGISETDREGALSGLVPRVSLSSVIGSLILSLSKHSLRSRSVPGTV